MTSEPQSTSRAGGIGFFGVLFLIFLTLKLMDEIDWSWWWVTAPLWAPFIFAIVVGAIIGTIAGIVTLINRSRRKRGVYRVTRKR